MRRPLMGLALAALCAAGPAKAEVIQRLPTQDKVVALTFDACETVTPSVFDKKILNYLLAEKLPFTLFVSGKFARRNADDLAALAKLANVEFENHSLSHHQDMSKLDDAAIAREVADNSALLQTITGQTPKFFRFPAGAYDARALADVEKQGLRVVHWRLPSGDPVKTLTPERLRQTSVAQTRPGDILIFHINGRGYSTGDALPGIVNDLRAKGYRFVRLDEMLP